MVVSVTIVSPEENLSSYPLCVKIILISRRKIDVADDTRTRIRGAIHRTNFPKESYLVSLVIYSNRAKYSASNESNINQPQKNTGIF